jgi:hypothetical protein
MFKLGILMFSGFIYSALFRPRITTYMKEGYLDVSQVTVIVGGIITRHFAGP